MKRNLLIAIFIVAVMVASGSIAYAATHKLDRTLSVSVNVTEELPISEDLYLDQALTQHAPDHFSVTYPKGASAKVVTLYVSGNISRDSLAFLPMSLPGDLMVTGMPQDALPSGVIPIDIVAIGGEQGYHPGKHESSTGISIRITGESN